MTFWRFLIIQWTSFYRRDWAAIRRPELISVSVTRWPRKSYSTFTPYLPDAASRAGFIGTKQIPRVTSLSLLNSSNISLKYYHGYSYSLFDLQPWDQSLLPISRIAPVKFHGLSQKRDIVHSPFTCLFSISFGAFPQYFKWEIKKPNSSPYSNSIKSNSAQGYIIVSTPADLKPQGHVPLKSTEPTIISRYHSQPSNSSSPWANATCFQEQRTTHLSVCTPQAPYWFLLKAPLQTWPATLQWAVDSSVWCPASCSRFIALVISDSGILEKV